MTICLQFRLCLLLLQVSCFLSSQLKCWGAPCPAFGGRFPSPIKCKSLALEQLVLKWKEFEMFLLFLSLLGEVWGGSPCCQLGELFGQWCASGGTSMGMSCKRLRIKQRIRKKSRVLLTQICCGFHLGFLGYAKKNVIGFPRKAEDKGRQGGLPGEISGGTKGHWRQDRWRHKRVVSPSGLNSPDAGFDTWKSKTPSRWVLCSASQNLGWSQWRWKHLCQVKNLVEWLLAMLLNSSSKHLGRGDDLPQGMDLIISGLFSSLSDLKILRHHLPKALKRLAETAGTQGRKTNNGNCEANKGKQA